jgi:3''-phosphoadenosine 5''-phosphosulfate sulfotransferase (PAPS reductase)/FAD synthetase and related enzymes
VNNKEWLEKWREYFLAWYDEGGVEDKANEAAEFSAKYLDEGVVSVSGGKDSMVMLHIIVNRCRRDINVFHWDHGPALMPRPVESEILRNIFRVASGARVTVKRFAKGFTERARAEWRDWYAAFFSTLRSLNYKYHLLGVRAEESSRRSARGRVVARRHWVEVHPVYYFTWRDVWAYSLQAQRPSAERVLQVRQATGLGQSKTSNVLRQGVREVRVTTSRQRVNVALQTHKPITTAVASWLRAPAAELALCSTSSRTS